MQFSSKQILMDINSVLDKKLFHPETKEPVNRLQLFAVLFSDYYSKEKNIVFNEVGIPCDKKIESLYSSDVSDYFNGKKRIPDKMLMYGKEASNRKQEIDRQHYTIPNQRPKDKHCGKI